jgi:hypothetical protein
MVVKHVKHHVGVMCVRGRSSDDPSRDRKLGPGCRPVCPAVRTVCLSNLCARGHGPETGLLQSTARSSNMGQGERCSTKLARKQGDVGPERTELEIRNCGGMIVPLRAVNALNSASLVL